MVVFWLSINAKISGGMGGRTGGLVVGVDVVWVDDCATLPVPISISWAVAEFGLKMRNMTCSAGWFAHPPRLAPSFKYLSNLLSNQISVFVPNFTDSLRSVIHVVMSAFYCIFKIIISRQISCPVIMSRLRSVYSIILLTIASIRIINSQQNILPCRQYYCSYYLFFNPLVKPLTIFYAILSITGNLIKAIVIISCLIKNLISFITNILRRQRRHYC